MGPQLPALTIYKLFRKQFLLSPVTDKDYTPEFALMYSQVKSCIYIFIAKKKKSIISSSRIPGLNFYTSIQKRKQQQIISDLKSKI